MVESLFIFAGEASGDVHGAMLMRALKAHYPDLTLFGVGGPLMRAEGLEQLLPMESFQVMGFVDVFFALPRLAKYFFRLKKILLERQPKAALFIDYPGFSMALEKALKRNHFRGKLCHYICPSVWAWGKKRIFQMEQTLDRLFVVFPFEKEYFDADKLTVDFVGHPLVKALALSSASDTQPPLLSLFPGSRDKELDRNLSMQLKVARRLKQLYPELSIAVSLAQPRFEATIRQALNAVDLSDAVIFGNNDKERFMQKSFLAIAKSGTITFELALHRIPTVVTYGVGKVDLFIARDLLRIKLPAYCIVNIILKETVFPELIGPQLTEERLFQEASRLLFSEEAREACREKCRQLATLFADKDPAHEVALFFKDLYRQAQNEPTAAHR